MLIFALPVEAGNSYIYTKKSIGIAYFHGLTPPSLPDELISMFFLLFLKEFNKCRNKNWE
jgi:hypothetical protein